MCIVTFLYGNAFPIVLEVQWFHCIPLHLSNNVIYSFCLCFINLICEYLCGDIFAQSPSPQFELLVSFSYFLKWSSRRDEWMLLWLFAWIFNNNGSDKLKPDISMAGLQWVWHDCASAWDAWNLTHPSETLTFLFTFL